jgi:putative ABC transport system permease protein
MRLSKLSFRNALRVRARAAMTLGAVALSLMAFVLLRSVSDGWTEQVRQTPKDRVVVRHKMGWGRSMPVNYRQAILEIDGVDAALGATWASLVHPRDPRLSFDSMALDARPFIELVQELEAPAEQRQAFIDNRMGAFVSRELADELGWKLGERVRFRTSALDRDLELTLSGIYQSKRHGFSSRALYFHWEYFNERLSERTRDGVNMLVAHVRDPGQGARVARDIDALFSGRDNPTFAQQDQATIAQLVARFGTVLAALDFLSLLILGVVLLILANTVAMGVRERAKEYATLRALGFGARHVLGAILGESAMLGALGGALCLLVSYPLIERVLGRFLEETAGFPPIHVSLGTSATTVLLGTLIGTLAAALPARRAATENVTLALRKVG